MNTTQDLITFNQANVDAFVKSGQIVAGGLQDMGKMFAASAQSSFQDAMATFRAMTSVRSVKEVMDLQAEFARTAFEKAMTQSKEVTESSFKLAEQAMAPIASRMGTATMGFRPAA